MNVKTISIFMYINRYHFEQVRHKYKTCKIDDVLDQRERRHTTSVRISFITRDQYIYIYIYIYRCFLSMIISNRYIIDTLRS